MAEVSNREICKYISQHEWKYAYKSNLLDSKNPMVSNLTIIKRKQRCLEYLFGTMGSDTFMDAFTWRYTPQGHGFWNKIHYNFCKLFYKDQLV